MREAIGGSWLFQIVIAFVLLFTGYMCLSINHTKAFDVKDKIINELERNGGVKNFNKDDYTIKNVVKYMKKVGYRTEDNCAEEFLNAKDKKLSHGCNRDGSCDTPPSKGKKYSFCIMEFPYDNTFKHYVNGEFLFLSYYKVQVFYRLDLPVIGSVFSFTINGDTKNLYRTQGRV